jgi:hypothetical protein
MKSKNRTAAIYWDRGGREDLLHIGCFGFAHRLWITLYVQYIVHQLEVKGTQGREHGRSDEMEWGKEKS